MAKRVSSKRAREWASAVDSWYTATVSDPLAGYSTENAVVEINRLFGIEDTTYIDRLRSDGLFEVARSGEAQIAHLREGV